MGRLCSDCIGRTFDTCVVNVVRSETEIRDVIEKLKVHHSTESRDNKIVTLLWVLGEYDEIS